MSAVGSKPSRRNRSASINFGHRLVLLAEESGSRTHGGSQATPTGFEVRPPHRERFSSYRAMLFV